MGTNDSNTPVEYSDYLPEGEQVEAIVFQGGQPCSKGRATREGKRLTFFPNDHAKPPQTLTPPIELKLTDKSGALTLRQALSWGSHAGCTHWDFDIQSYNNE